MPQISRTTIALHGYCPWSLNELGTWLEDFRDPAELPGDCIVSAEGADADGSFELVVSSALSCHNYYWSSQGNAFHHGPQLFDLIRRAKLPWRWNNRAVASVLTAQFTTDTDTLHAAVSRLGPATRLIWRNCALSVYQSAFWHNVFHGPRSTLQEASNALVSVAEESASQVSSLSLSGGFDSRVLLCSYLSWVGDQSLARWDLSEVQM